MDYLNINTAIIGVFALILGVQLITTLFKPPEFNPPPNGFLVPQQVGKTKHIQSMTGDASMYTERSRRRAIIGGHSCGTKGFWQKHSTNGSLETYFLTSLCPTFFKEPSIVFPTSVIFDGGDAYDEYTYIMDGNGGLGEVTLDLGNADTTVCGI